jgi:hypothetical protein
MLFISSAILLVFVSLNIGSVCGQIDYEQIQPFEDRSVCTQACPGHNSCQPRQVTIDNNAFVTASGVSVMPEIVTGTVGVANQLIAAQRAYQMPVGVSMADIVAAQRAQLRPIGPFAGDHR